MNDNTVCCQNRELTEPTGETAGPYKVSLALERTPNGRPYGVGGERRLFAKGVLSSSASFLGTFPAGEG